MLSRGIDTKSLGSLREAVLLQELQRQEELEHLRFMLLMKAPALDTKDQNSVDEMNKLLDKYYDLMYPQREKLTKPEAVAKRQKLLDDFTLKLKEKKIRNFQRAK